MTPSWRKTPERLPGHENVVLRLAAFALPRSEQFNDISRDIDLARATILRTVNSLSVKLRRTATTASTRLTSPQVNATSSPSRIPAAAVAVTRRAERVSERTALLMP